MAQPTFNGRIDITATSQLDVNLFEVAANFTDNQGVWFGSDVAVGDFIFVDMSGWSPGNVGRYQVSSVVASDSFTFTIQVFFTEPGDVVTFDFLASSVGSVVRPTPNLKLAIAPLQAIQQIPENIAIQPQNEGLFDTIDNLSGGSTPPAGLLNAYGYVFTQSSPSTTWNITHNAGSLNISTQILDATGNGNVIFPDEITIIDVNNIQVTFQSAQAGKALLTVFL